MRNTTIEDAAASVSTNVSRWRETAHTQPVIYQQRAPFPGGESQGRFAPWQPLTEGDTPDAGPQAACTHGMEDAGEQLKRKATEQDIGELLGNILGWAAFLTICGLMFLWRAV